MRMWRTPCTLILLCAALGSARSAAALEAGTTLFSLEATQGDADLVSTDGPYLSAYQHGELGGQIQIWHLVSPSTALTLTGGAGATRERNSAEGQPDRYYQQRSVSGRIGADRMVELGRDALLYFGPGIEYWRGYARFNGYYPPAGSSVQEPTVSRWSVSGRFGAIMILTSKVGLTGHIGYRLGTASASDGGADSQWYTNGVEGSAGLVFAF